MCLEYREVGRTADYETRKESDGGLSEHLQQARAEHLYFKLQK